MPKIKTHKATAKRFKYSAKGKLLRTKIGKSHFRRRKPRRVKALFDKTIEVKSAKMRRRVKRLAPYLDKA